MKSILLHWIRCLSLFSHRKLKSCFVLKNEVKNFRVKHTKRIRNNCDGVWGADTIRRTDTLRWPAFNYGKVFGSLSLLPRHIFALIGKLHRLRIAFKWTWNVGKFSSGLGVYENLKHFPSIKNFSNSNYNRWRGIVFFFLPPTTRHVSKTSSPYTNKERRAEEKEKRLIGRLEEL